MKQTLIFFLIVLNTGNLLAQSKSSVPPTFDYYRTAKDIDKYAFFKFDPKRDDHIFHINSKPSTLSKNELLNIEKLIAIKRLIIITIPDLIRSNIQKNTLSNLLQS